MTVARKLSENWIHLGLGAGAQAEPPFDGMDWYAAYAQRTADDGAEGRLVSMHSFSSDWDVWEMHPLGAEVVICTAGSIELVQQVDGHEICVRLGAGDYAINPAGIWHTANIASRADAIFITAGQGTEHRQR